MLIKCLAIVLKRADAARAALDKAREEEYKRRVGMCGVSNEHGASSSSHFQLQPPAIGLERSTETFCPSEGAKTR